MCVCTIAYWVCDINLILPNCCMCWLLFMWAIYVCISLLCERERGGVCVCMCVCMRERERESVCVCSQTLLPYNMLNSYHAKGSRQNMWLVWPSSICVCLRVCVCTLKHYCFTTCFRLVTPNGADKRCRLLWLSSLCVCVCVCCQNIMTLQHVLGHLMPEAAYKTCRDCSGLHHCVCVCCQTLWP